ncbi:hypothetical protein [Alicyclobacillus fodiniaquatilis]|uniref:Uncharacterized protein n=1 Tax=Alicyclobacillus fodiniaquatilis TaxID=1661150 RepID=A0ABW4JJ05_9BACL
MDKLPKTVLKTVRYIRQDATLDQLIIIEQNVMREIIRRRQALKKPDKLSHRH